jgi:hypothetical protein
MTKPDRSCDGTGHRKIIADGLLLFVAHVVRSRCIGPARVVVTS